MKKIIVLAGSRQQFKDYLARNGLTDSQAVYGYEENILRGFEAEKVEAVGTFWERDDAVDLYEIAQSRVR